MELGDRPLPTDAVIIAPMSRKMIPEVGKIHFEAFAGYMNTRLGKYYIEAFLEWFLTAEQAIALVALDCRRDVLGYILGAPMDYGKSMNRDLLRIAAISIMLRPWLFGSKTFWRIIIGRIRSALNCMPTDETLFHLPEPRMGLIAIGVARTAREKKVGLHLMQAFEEKARKGRMRSLQLTVYADNIAARRLYESCSWTPLLVGDVENKTLRYFRILTDEANQ